MYIDDVAKKAALIIILDFFNTQNLDFLRTSTINLVTNILRTIFF